MDTRLGVREVRGVEVSSNAEAEGDEASGVDEEAVMVAVVVVVVVVVVIRRG